MLAADIEGNIVSSDFLMFLDQDPVSRREFYVFETEKPNRKLRLTPAHLVFITNNVTDDDMTAVFASNVKPGQQVFVVDEALDHLKAVTVERIYVEEYEGSYAPVTSQGTIIVDHVLASCYAVIEDHKWAHWAFAPVRFGHALMSFTGLVKKREDIRQRDGIHWYSDILYHIGTLLLDINSFHPLGMSQS